MDWKKLTKAMLWATVVAVGLWLSVSGLCYIFNEFGITAVGVCLGLALWFTLTCIFYDDEAEEYNENGGV